MPQFTINFCSRITLFNVFFFTLFYSLSSLTLGGGGGVGGPALCLNFGPSSELGVNEGVVPCFWFISAFIKFLPFFFIGSCFILFQS